ncbi:hypothetical protein JCM16358_24480 [Halanaerocella petrolearia]
MKKEFENIFSSIKLKLIIVLLIIILVPVFILSYLQIQKTESILQQNFIAATKREIKQVNNTVDVYFDRIKGECKSLASSYIVEEVDKDITSYVNKGIEKELQMNLVKNGGVETRIYNKFSSFAQIHSNISYVYLATKDGGYIQWPSRSVPQHYDPRKSYFYKMAMKNKGQVSIIRPYYRNNQETNPYSWANNRDNKIPTVSIVTTVENNEGKIIGVLGLNISLKGLVDKIKSISMKNKSYVIVTTKDGIILNHSQKPKYNFQNITEIGVDKLNNIVEMEQGNFKVNMNNKNYFVSVNTSLQTGWKFIFGVEESKLNQDLYYIYEVVFSVIIIFTSMMIVMITIFSNKFLQPIITATDFAQKIADKKLDISPLQIKTNDEVGRLSRALNIMKDNLHSKMEELNQLNQELKHEKNELHKYLDVAEVIFLVLDKEGKVELINKKGCHILEYDEEEMIDKNWFDNFTKEEETKEAKNNFKAMMNEKPELREYFEQTILTKNNEERKVAWHISLLRDNEDNNQGILASGVDVTKQKMLKEELEYNKFKVEFFANLSHELKTPLNLIFSSLQMLDLYHKTNIDSESYQKAKKYTATIRQNGYRMLRLTNNLVDITKINSNSFKLNIANHDIVETVKEVTYSVADYIDNKDRRWQFNSELEEKIVAFDTFSMERIILNLLSNAIKFTEEGDEIFVNISTQKDKVLISVIDTGVGIPVDQQENIFKRFRQVDKSFTRNNEGSGIGLSIVKLLVELHGGKIIVNSRYGVGTEFIIELSDRVISEDRLDSNHIQQQKELIDKIDVELSDIYDL